MNFIEFNKFMNFGYHQPLLLNVNPIPFSYHLDFEKKSRPTSPGLVSLRFFTPSFRGSKTPSVKAKSAEELRVQDGLTIGKRNSCGIGRYQP